MGIDWHRTIASEGGVASASNTGALAALIAQNYDQVLISFASKKARQEEVLRYVRELSRTLGFSLRVIVTPQKFSRDGDALTTPSRSGHTGSKAAHVLQQGCSVYIDNQPKVLKDVRALQRELPLARRTLILRAATDQSFTLRPLSP